MWRRAGAVFTGGVLALGVGGVAGKACYAADHRPPGTNPYYAASSAPPQDAGSEELAEARRVAQELVEKILAASREGRAAVNELNETRRKAVGDVERSRLAAQKQLAEDKDDHIATLHRKLMDEITRILNNDPSLKYVLDSYKTKVAEHIQREAERELARVIDDTTLIQTVKARGDAAVAAAREDMDTQYRAYTSALLRWTLFAYLVGAAGAAACILPKL